MSSEIKVEIKRVSLSEISLNEKNPRWISKAGMQKLVKSLKGFPDMMRLREIVVDEDMKILGGNMRYLASRELGEKDVLVKVVSGLSEGQKREFIIKDNSNYGEYDFDILANEWDDLPLDDWGVDLVPIGDAVTDDFFEEDLFAAARGESGLVSITFVFEEGRESEAVKLLIDEKGKKYLTDRIVELCEAENSA